MRRNEKIDVRRDKLQALDDIPGSYFFFRAPDAIPPRISAAPPNATATTMGRELSLADGRAMAERINNIKPIIISNEGA